MPFGALPRVKLIANPTPLEYLPRFGELIGHRGAYIKRDDMMSIGMGGNKLRNLEFWLGKAKRQGADVIIAAGGEQSNQCRLTAAACAKLGLKCILVHNCKQPQLYQGNMLLNSLVGAEQVFLGTIDEDERGERVDQLARELKLKGKRPYIIGKEYALGALGYANAAIELFKQTQEMGIDLKHVVIVGAMGGTATGFVYGTAWLNKPFHVHVISVEYEELYLRQRMEHIFNDCVQLTGEVPSVAFDRVMTIYEQFLGDGYGEPTTESLQVVHDLARTEGIFLENVYTSKTAWGMRKLIADGIIPSDEAVCYVHTGGSPALFAQADMFQPRTV